MNLSDPPQAHRDLDESQKIPYRIISEKFTFHVKDEKTILDCMNAIYFINMTRGYDVKVYWDNIFFFDNMEKKSLRPYQNTQIVEFLKLFPNVEVFIPGNEGISLV